MKVGILTGGGDCPGLNPVIRAATRKLLRHFQSEVLGIRYGWAGFFDQNTVSLDVHAIAGILPKGGTILGTSRTNPFKIENGPETLMKNFKEMGLEALIVIGGEDTLGVANRLHKEYELPVVGVPKTIDNDLDQTDYTFGFDTAVNIVMEAIDRLHTTAESHQRVIVVEVMGRHAGWIATYGGIAGGADCILIPEKPFKISDVCELIRKRHQKRKKLFSIIVVAEGAKVDVEGDLDGSFVLKDMGHDAFGHVKLGGIGDILAKEIERELKIETRVTVLGHIQRGGTPTAFDRILGTSFGVRAAELVHERKFGNMVALHGTKVVPVPIEDAVKKLKTLDMEIFDIAKVFFG